MDKYIKQVASKLEVINHEGVFYEDTILSLVVLIRQHLEANKLKKKYSITAFYCDWCLHVALDRSPTVKEFLRQINAAISNGKEISFNDKINEIITVQRLRKELVEIISSAGASSRLFTSYEGWKAFLRVLLKSLVEKPIVSMDQPVSGRYASEFRFEVPDLSNVDKDYLTQNAITPDTVFWKVLVLPDGYSLTGPLVITESPSDFE